MHYILQISNGDKAYNLGSGVGSFIADNLFLIIGLIIGIIAAIVMRKTLNAKP